MARPAPKYAVFTAGYFGSSDVHNVIVDRLRRLLIIVRQGIAIVLNILVKVFIHC